MFFRAAEALAGRNGFEKGLSGLVHGDRENQHAHKYNGGIIGD